MSRGGRRRAVVGQFGGIGGIPQPKLAKNSFTRAVLRPIRRRRGGRPFQLRARRRKADRLSLIGWLLVLIPAFAGGVSYLIWQNSTVWWVGQIAALPLLIAIVLRQEEPPKDAGHFQEPSGGPWWSP